MKEFFYILMVCSILFTNTSCKDDDNDGDYPLFSLGFFFVDKTTGENLVGEGKPYSRYDLEVYVMYKGNPATRKNYVNNYSIRDNTEFGDVIMLDSDATGKTDFIVYLGDLEPDTITLVDGVYREDFYDTEIHLNGENVEKLTVEHLQASPIIKIEK